MRIIKPYAQIDYEDSLYPSDLGLRMLKKIEKRARLSHRSEDKTTDESWKRFLQFVVMEKGDWSVVEHASLTVDFCVDRGITHEIVRHRHFSYTQESTRFINYEKNGRELEFIEPFSFTSSAERVSWQEAVGQAAYRYKEQLTVFKNSPQIARSVLPNALASRIAMTGNLRAWRHFLRMRTTKEAHPQMREVTLPLLNDFKNCVPLLYDDIMPEMRQADAVRLPC